MCVSCDSDYITIMRDVIVQMIMFSVQHSERDPIKWAIRGKMSTVCVISKVIKQDKGNQFNSIQANPFSHACDH